MVAPVSVIDVIETFWMLEIVVSIVLSGGGCVPVWWKKK
jgi:hypothetical protein